jgi:radical SAM superfamily enzyme YgiQ (UPF0313 family)
MKICLVNTLTYSSALNSAQASSYVDEFYLPLGLLSVAAVLERSGHTVEVLDPNLIAYDERISDIKFLDKQLVARIEACNPDWVGFTTMCDSYYHTISLAKKLRADISVPIVLGGPQATATASETLEAFSAIDFILHGESESSLPYFLDALEGRILFEAVPGLTFRDRGQIRTSISAPLIPNLDDLPAPAFHHYSQLAGRLQCLPIEAGRGCPFSCDFCSTALFWERKYRLKSGQRMLQEIELLEGIFGTGKLFRFIHDMLTVDKRLVRRFCEILAQADPVRSWTCSARVDCVDAELLELMARAGCRSVYFGVESGSLDMQQKMKKRLKVEQILPRVATARSLGMEVTVSFMSGFPEETLSDLEETLVLVFECVRQHGDSVEVQMHSLAPYIGTEVYDKNEADLRFDGYFSDQTGQLISALDVLIIEEYPKLFSNFYYIPTKHYPRRILFGLDSFIYILLKRFRLTLLLLEGYVGSPLRIYLDWQKLALSLTSPEKLAFVNADEGVVLESFTLLLKDYLSSFSEQDRAFILEVKRFEDVRASVSNITLIGADSTGASEREQPLHLASFGVDIEKLQSYLLGQSETLAPDMEHTYSYLFVQTAGGRTVPIPLSSDAAETLACHVEKSNALPYVLSRMVGQW